jgi:PIN domain nuclease of toxin-antitoxin system
LTNVLLDTHVFAWALYDSARIPKRTLGRISRATTAWISAVSFYEIGQKVRAGKWAEMAPYYESLPAHVEDQGATSRDVDPAIALRAAALDWPHRDPFDRFIAATAIELGVALVSADTAFDVLTSSRDWPGRIW